MLRGKTMIKENSITGTLKTVNEKIHSFVPSLLLLWNYLLIRNISRSISIASGMTWSTSMTESVKRKHYCTNVPISGQNVLAQEGLREGTHWTFRSIILGTRRIRRKRGPEGVHFGIYHEINFLLSKRTISDFLGEENT